MISGDQNDHAQTPLYGLVLAGGRSVRMGVDKGLIAWHGKEQRYFMADLLGICCSKVFISCRAEQEPEIAPQYRALVDNQEGAGPVVGILTALKAYPGAAWLVVACDLPLLDQQTIEYLASHRDPSCVATTFKSPFDGLPEPLITIWEPSGFGILKAHLAEGYSCPRKALIRNEARVNMLEPPDPGALMNANTPGDAEQVEEIIRAKQIRFLS